MQEKKNSEIIRKEAKRLGFSYIGFSKAQKLEEEAQRLEDWLQQGMHGKMSYMENHFEKRLDPGKLVPGAKSVISLLYNYYTDKRQTYESAPKISKYSFGKDYHFVLKRKLKDLLTFMRENIGEVSGRVFVDSAPVMEKAWAKKSGIGWVGKNANIIHPKSGSFFFLAELIIDLPLEYDGPIKDYCGSCTACIDACPTDAIVDPYVVDGSRCISYFTIELKDEIIPNEMKGKFENWAFGCDICQDVCPWNRFSKEHSEPDFEAKEQMLNMTKKEWQEITEDVFQELFKKSPIKRTKFKGLKRNISFLNPSQKK